MGFKIRSMLLSLIFVSGILLVLPFSAKATITSPGSVMDGLYGNQTAGPGSQVTMAKFMLQQTDGGSHTLTQVGFTIRASSTINQFEISRISLWRESGARGGFQPAEDIHISGAASTSPMIGTWMILAPTTPVTISSTPTEFYLVASTTSTIGTIVNGHAFDITMDANWASTSALTGIGNVFTPQSKLTLQQTIPIKISEVKYGSTSNADDEFIELYNQNDFPINLSDAGLQLYIIDANASAILQDGAGDTGSKNLNYYKKIIPEHGYFLIGSATNYSGSTALDATFSTLAGQKLVANGGIAIATSTSFLNATSSAIDRIGWDTHPASDCEGGACYDAAPSANDFAVDKGLERKALTGSTAASMASGGADQMKGNGFDSGVNANDFVLQNSPMPQNSSSPTEMPMGGGGFQDSERPRVTGSYPSNSMTGVPVDRTYIGFMLNEPVQSGTLVSTSATTTVTLVPQNTAPANVAAANLCSSVTYNPAPGSFEPPVRCNFTSTTLQPSITYIFEVGTSTASAIRDFQGNAFDQDSFQSDVQSYQAVFTAGGSSQTQTMVTPPRVVATTPMMGSFQNPINIAKLFIVFDQAMNINTLNASTITLTDQTSGGSVSLAGSTFAFTGTGSTTLSVTLGSNLSANSRYELIVAGGVQSMNGIAIPPFYASFETGSGSDATAPQILGTMPIQANAAAVSANKTNFTFVFSDHIDASTATSGAVTLATGGSTVPGSVSYDAQTKELRFSANNTLPLNSTMTFTVKGGSIKNISGTKLGADYTLVFTTEQNNSDSTAPGLLFAEADDFGMAVTFNEAVRSTDATNLSNYSITAGSAITLSTMAGHSITYDPAFNTAKISNIKLPPGTVFTLTASNINDISGNLMGTASIQGTVRSYASSGGLLGPGQMTGSFGPPPDTSFTSGTIGAFMPGIEVRPFNSFKSASSTYGIGLPISQRIDANGQVVISFPSSSDFNLCCVVTTSDTYFGGANKDINGPGGETVGISSIANNNLAKTITLTIDNATRSESMGGSTDTHDFLHFDLLDIRNPSVPKGPDAGGYAVTIKTKDSTGKILESFNSQPVYITGGSFGGKATTTLRGQILASNGNYGLNGIKLRSGSPATGPIETMTASSVWGSGHGEFQFTDLPVGFDYMLFTDPTVGPTQANGAATTSRYFGLSEPQPIRATSTDIHLLNVTLTSTSSAMSFGIKLVAAANTFSATEKVDVFAGGPGKFISNTETPGTAERTAGSVFSTVYIPQSVKSNGMWNIGVGPAMPKDGMFMGPPPSVNWTMPKPVDIQVTGCPSNCAATVGGSIVTSHTFSISTASFSISGVLKDSSSNVISSAMVFAYSSALGFGQHAETSPSGVFTLRVPQGTYSVGAFFPGIGKSQEVSVEVDSSGNNYIAGSKTVSTGSTGSNPFILKMIKPPYTIQGRVTDGTNAVPNSPVYAYKTSGSGHSDTMTDSNGNYKLYVDSGTWTVGTHLPGYGPLDEKTITVTTSSVVGSSPGTGETLGDTNFAPASNATYWSVTGTIFESADAAIDSGEEVDSVMVNIKSSTNKIYIGKTGVDGKYTVRVPQGNSYTMSLDKPGYGQIGSLDENLIAIGTFNVTGTTTKNVRLNSRQTVTINIKDATGSLMNVPEASIDFFDMTKSLGNRTKILNASSTTLLVPNMSTTTIRVFMPSVPPNAVSFTGGGSTDFVSGTSNTVVNVDGSETINVTVNTNLRMISGTIYHTAASAGNELKDVWIEVVDATNGFHFGTQATSTNGAYSIKLSDGTYKIMAVKPGYTMVPQTLTVSANATQNLILTSASLTIAGSVTAGGSAAKEAFVRAEKVGGGFAVAKTDLSGNYTLSVDSGTWRVFAAAERYPQAAYSGNPLTVSTSQTGINIVLSTAATGIQTATAMSSTFTDNSSGSLSDATVKVNVTVDSGALGQTGSSAYLTAKETVNFVETSSVNIIADKAKEINAYSGTSQVKDLQSGKKATVELTYTTTELGTIDTPAEVANLRISAFSESTGQWESLNTSANYLDSNGNALASPATTSASFTAGTASIKFTTSEATHFSLYALSESVDGAPNTPSGITATAGAAGTFQVSLSWGSVSNATGYYLYRATDSSGLFPLLADAGNTTSYTDTGLSATTYYYKVASYKSGGALESAASSASSVTLLAVGGGGIISGGGGSIAPTIPPQTPTVTTTVTQITQAPSTSVITSLKTVSVSPVFKKILKLGMSGADTKRLQKLLNSDPDTQIASTGVGSPGNETEYFGSLTVKALQKFQKKYNVVSSGSPETTGYGALGPKTRAKLVEVFSQATPTAPAVAPASPTGGQPSPIAVSVSPVFTIGFGIGKTSSDVKRLQQLLNSNPDTQISSSGTGSSGNETNYFGSLTEKAVQKFQKKYNIAKEGDSGYGYIGPKTRAKIQEVFKK